MAATDGDDGDGGATMPKMTGGGGGLGERRDGARRHGRTRERGQTKEEITGKVYMSSNRRDQAANVRNRVGKISDSVLEINSKTNSNLIQTSTICFDSWGKRKRRPRGTKPLNQSEKTESDSAGFGAGNGG
uniref:Uncharacterized protein n=1 Tax=Oryza sativa subsp. japonica TaxID=39947 RepID=Q7XFA4_ORYSJ|nr:hypothetical protein LOC_Os10g22150 [Oryza sativa Japonica Group]